MAPRRKTRRASPKRLLWLLLFLLLLLLVSWLVGWRPALPRGEKPEEQADVRRASASGKSFVPARVQRFTVNEVTRSLRPTGGSVTEAPPDTAGDTSTSPGRCFVHGRLTGGADTLTVRLVAARDGSSVAGLPVSTELGRAVPDAEGRWSVDVAPTEDGRARVLIEDSRGGMQLGGVVDLVPWAAVSAGEVPVDLGGRIEVTVAGPTAATVALRPRPDPGSPLLLDEAMGPVLGAGARTVVAGADGRATFADVGAGPWEVVVFADGFLPQRHDAEPGAVLGGIRLAPVTRRSFVVEQTFSTRILVAGPEARPLAVTGVQEVAGPTSVFGPGAKVHRPTGAALDLADVLHATTLRLPPNGRVTWPEGPWTVHLGAPGPVSGESRADAERPGFLTRALAPGSHDLTWREASTGREIAGGTVTVTPHETVELIPPVRSDTARTLELRVVDDGDERPIAGALISLGHDFAGVDALLPVVGRSDDDGVFRMEGAPAGKLDIVVSSPAHRPVRREVTVTDLTRLEVRLVRGAHADIVVTDELGRPHGALTVAAIDRRGRVHRGETDAEGRVRLGPLAPGDYGLLAVFGQLSVPLDSWRWIRNESGARIFTMDGSDHELSWQVPATRRWRAQVSLPGGRGATLQIVPAGARAPAPGVWPDLLLGRVERGPIEIDRMLPGRYTALARIGDVVDAVDFEVVAGALVGQTLVFDFEDDDR